MPAEAVARRPLALVTGASGGIGLDIARELTERGCDLVIVARNVERLKVVAEELRKVQRATVHMLPADLEKPDAVTQLVRDLNTRALDVDILVNNAGFGATGPFAKTDLTGQLGMIQVNVTALTELTHRLLPGMIERRSGRVLNVASTAAFQPGPFMAVYYASKAYVLSFTEALAFELRGSGVTVTALCPGPTRTQFAGRAGNDTSRLFKGPFVMPSSEVARIGVRSMFAGRHVVVPGFTNWLAANFPRFAPRNLVTAATAMAQEGSRGMGALASGSPSESARSDP